VDYAAEVHEHPERPRPWVDVTLADFDICDRFRENYKGLNTIDVCFFNTMDELGDEFTLTIDEYEWNYTSTNRKRHIPEYTWRTITDSGDLADSLTITYS
jgi:hypothetical protein